MPVRMGKAYNLSNSSTLDDFFLLFVVVHEMGGSVVANFVRVLEYARGHSDQNDCRRIVIRMRIRGTIELRITMRRIWLS